MTERVKNLLGFGLMAAYGTLLYFGGRDVGTAAVDRYHELHPEPPTVVLPPIVVSGPRCRHAGAYGLGNRQKDSTAVLLICKKDMDR